MKTDPVNDAAINHIAHSLSAESAEEQDEMTRLVEVVREKMAAYGEGTFVMGSYDAALVLPRPAPEVSTPVAWRCRNAGGEWEAHIEVPSGEWDEVEPLYLRSIILSTAPE